MNVQYTDKRKLPEEVWVGGDYQKNGFVLDRNGNMVMIEFADNTKLWVNQSIVAAPHQTAPRHGDIIET